MKNEILKKALATANIIIATSAASKVAVGSDLKDEKISVISEASSIDINEINFNPQHDGGCSNHGCNNFGC